MNPHLVILFVGFFYILIFGSISLLKREGLSNRFAVEVAAITVLTALGAFLTNTVVSPILFFVLVYLVSMRARILVDAACMLASRGEQERALSILSLARRLWPDRASDFIVQINRGIVLLQQGNPKEAQELFTQVLDEAEKQGGLGLKYEAACRYNLAVACNRQGNEAEAVRQFNEVTELLPASIYSRAAERAIQQRRESGLRRPQTGERLPLDSPPSEENSAP